MSNETNPPQPPEVHDERPTPVEVPDVATQPHPTGHPGARPTTAPGTTTPDQNRSEEAGRPPEPGSPPADDVPTP